MVTVRLYIWHFEVGDLTFIDSMLFSQIQVIVFSATSLVGCAVVGILKNRFSGNCFSFLTLECRNILSSHQLMIINLVTHKVF